MKERHNDEIPTWLQWLGVDRITEYSIETRWGFFAPQFGFEFMYGLDYENNNPYIRFCLIWGVFFIRLPTWLTDHIGSPGELDEYYSGEHSDIGITIHNETFWIYRGKKEWITWNLPWFSRIHDDKFHALQNSITGEWRTAKSTSSFILAEPDTYDVKEDPDFIEVHPFVYKSKTGPIQFRVVHLIKERRRWKRKWFAWLPQTWLMQYSMGYEFNTETGHKVGNSWKSGTSASGVNIDSHTTIPDAFDAWKISIETGEYDL